MKTDNKLLIVSRTATAATATTAISASEKEPREVESDVFESLDSLKLASNSLLPPFKTVGVSNDPIIFKGCSSSNKGTSDSKVYTQSQTFLVSKELNIIARP